MVEQGHDVNADAQPRAVAITRALWRGVVAAGPRTPILRGHRRADRRFAVPVGHARLDFDLPNGEGQRHVVRTVPIMEVSADGLGVKSHAAIPPHTVVNLEVSLDGRTLALQGRVVHTTETVGGYKVGIRLEFAPGAHAS